MAEINPRQVVLRTGDVALIRSATPEDAAAIVEINRRAVEEGDFTLRELDEFTTTKADEKNRISEYTEKPGCIYLVAEVDGNVVGFIEFENGNKRRTAHLGTLSIFLFNEWRGKGVGTALMQSLLDWAVESPLIEKLSLTTFSTNTAAIGLYKKMGFVEEGRCPGDMKMPNGSYVDSVLMYRFVKP